MNRAAGSTARRIHHRTSLESRWQEWVSQPATGRSPVRPSHEAIARLAYALWEYRGRPIGDAEQDWYRAERELAGEPVRSDSEN